MSIVLGGKVDARWASRIFWRTLLAGRVLSVRARMQKPGDGADTPAQRSASASIDSHILPGPAGSQDAAFDAFFTQHERALYGYLRRMLGSHDAALDVAQEAFFRAWQRFETVRGYDRPQAWLFRVATNLALDALRRQQLGRFASRSRYPGNEPHDEATASEQDAASAALDPSDMEGSLAERDIVNQTLALLPERQRAALLLWAAHGLSIAEIAAALETTEVNVRQLMSRGRARFRELYEQMGTNM